MFSALFSTQRSPRSGLWRRMMLLFGIIVCLPGIALAQTQSKLATRVERLERALDSHGLVDLLQQVELLQQEIRQLRGELENQVFALEQVRKSQHEAYTDANRRLAQLEGGETANAPSQLPGVAVDPPLPTLTPPSGVAVAGTPSDLAMTVDIPTSVAALAANLTGSDRPPPAEPDALPTDGRAQMPGSVAMIEPAAVTPAASEIVSSPTPSILPTVPTIDSAESEAAYREAFEMLKAGQSDESIASFNNFLQTYPSSQYADNAQYWLGEAYWVMSQFEPAIDQYQKLVNGYPDSKKRPHAMLKIAYCYHKLGLADEAVGILTDLKTQFPGSAASRLADERMQRIRAESH